MKKITPFVIVALFGALTFTSCKKDYKCTCKFNNSFFASGDTTITWDLGKQKKSNAKAACNNESTAYQIYGAGSCSLN